MENKTSKPAFAAGRYLKYAIGEIVLVMVGILLALQVNTWNEERKNTAKVKVGLKSVYNDLIKDSIMLSSVMPNIIAVSNRNTLLIEKAYASSTNLDTLIKIMKEDFEIFWIGNLTFNHNTFDNFKSTGSFEILPVKIKQVLSNFYVGLESRERSITSVNNQYRNHLDEFLKNYNLIGRIDNVNYKNSYLYESSWKNIDPKHFTPRVAIMLGSYKVLYYNVKINGVWVQEEIRKIMTQLKPYIE